MWLAIHFWLISTGCGPFSTLIFSRASKKSASCVLFATHGVAHLRRPGGAAACRPNLQTLLSAVLSVLRLPSPPPLRSDPRANAAVSRLDHGPDHALQGR